MFRVGIGHDTHRLGPDRRVEQRGLPDHPLGRATPESGQFAPQRHRQVDNRLPASVQAQIGAVRHTLAQQSVDVVAAFAQLRGQSRVTAVPCWMRTTVPVTSGAMRRR